MFVMHCFHPFWSKQKLRHGCLNTNKYCEEGTDQCRNHYTQFLALKIIIYGPGKHSYTQEVPISWLVGWKIHFSSCRSPQGGPQTYGI